MNGCCVTPTEPQRAATHLSSGKSADRCVLECREEGPGRVSIPCGIHPQTDLRVTHLHKLWVTIWC